MHGERKTPHPHSLLVGWLAWRSCWTSSDHSPIPRAMLVSDTLPDCSGPGRGLVGFWFFFDHPSVVYKTVMIPLHLLPRCLRLHSCPPMSPTNRCWKRKGKTGIGSKLCVVPHLSESIGRGNPRRTHPTDAGAEPCVAMVTGEMGPGTERGL